MTRIAIFALTLLALLSAPAAYADDWREYRSQNLIIYSNVDDAVVKQLIDDTERLIPYLADVTGINKTSTPLPLTMYIYRNISEIRHIVGEHHVLGGYRPRLRGGVAIAVGIDQVDKRKLGGRSVVLHEYVHHYLEQLSPLDYPIWFIEGFADVMSNINYRNSDVRIGEMLIPRVRMLNDRSSWAPLGDILAATTPDVGKTKKWRGHDRFYSQSWLLAHMLTTLPEFNQNSRHFLKELSEGVNPEEAIRASYGMSLKTFEDHFKNHWKQGLQIDYIDVPRKYVTTGAIEIRDLTDSEARAIKWKTRADFSDTPERIVEVIAGIQADLKKKDNLEMRLTLTDLLLTLGRADLALKQIDHMMEMDPNHKDVHFIKAKVKLNIAIKRYTAFGPDGVDKKIYEDAHHYLRDVIANDPNNTEALFYFGVLHFLNDKADLSGDGFSALKRAQELVPQNLEITLLMAQMHSKLGEVADACEKANVVLKFSRVESLKDRALKVIAGQPSACPA